MEVKTETGKREEKHATYADSGVDIGRAEQALRLMMPHIKTTHDKYVLGSEGQFAPAFDLGGLMREYGIKDPVLLSSTDGPGTIPLISAMVRDGFEAMSDSFVPIGYNVAAHCMADGSCEGGRPIFYLDSISSAKIDPRILEEIAKGMAEACLEVGCRLIGGETAELPGVITEGQTNFEGFVISLVEKSRWIQPRQLIRPGNAILGIESKGIMVNGVSLARKIALVIKGMTVFETLTDNRSFAEELLHRQPNFARILLDEPEMGIWPRGNANITGGGLPDNVLRILPDGCRAVIEPETWETPPIFDWLIEAGNVELPEAYHTWNMGIGFVQIFEDLAAAQLAAKFIADKFGLRAWIIGDIVAGERVVDINF